MKVFVYEEFINWLFMLKVMIWYKRWFFCVWRIYSDGWVVVEIDFLCWKLWFVDGFIKNWFELCVLFLEINEVEEVLE